jgi:hypothetical protein
MGDGVNLCIVLRGCSMTQFENFWFKVYFDDDCDFTVKVLPLMYSRFGETRAMRSSFAAGTQSGDMRSSVSQVL